MSMYTTDQKVPGSAEPSMASLVSGVVNDVQRLLKQHLALFRQEVHEDVNRFKRGAMAFAMSLLMAIVGAAFVLTALVGLLAWAFPAIAWWGWAGILGLAFTGIAFALCLAGRKSIASIGVEQTTQEIKEDIQWLKK